MTYRDVCGKEACVWFYLTGKKREGKKLLRWARSLGCVWMNGDEIDPGKGTDFFVLSMRSDGTLANVPAMAHAAERSEGRIRINFREYYKTRKAPDRA